MAATLSRDNVYTLPLFEDEKRRKGREATARYRAKPKGQASVERSAAKRAKLGSTRVKGVTRELYAHMSAMQNHVCAMCGQRQKSGRRLCVDHDHVTEKVRALLCTPCNVLVGYAEHPMLAAATKYLETWR